MLLTYSGAATDGRIGVCCRLEIAALDRVMTDCEDELQKFRAWRSEQQGREKNHASYGHGGSGEAPGGYYYEAGESHQEELSTLRRLLSETEEEIRNLRLIAIQQQQQWVQSNQRPEEYLSPEEQQVLPTPLWAAYRAAAVPCALLVLCIPLC